MNPSSPAFPWNQTLGNQDNLGLTKREYIAVEMLKAVIVGVAANPHFVGWTPQGNFTAALQYTDMLIEALAPQSSAPPSSHCDASCNAGSTESHRGSP